MSAHPPSAHQTSAHPPGDPALYGDLARRLHEDADGLLAAELCRYFESLQLAAKQKLHEPLQPEEFETNAAVAAGTELCAQVISSVWQSMRA